MLPHLKSIQDRLQHLASKNKRLKANQEMNNSEMLKLTLLDLEEEDPFEKQVLDSNFRKRAMSVNEELSKLVVSNPESEEVLQAKLDTLRILKDLKVYQEMHDGAPSLKKSRTNDSEAHLHFEENLMWPKKEQQLQKRKKEYLDMKKWDMASKEGVKSTKLLEKIMTSEPRLLQLKKPSGAKFQNRKEVSRVKDHFDDNFMMKAPVSEDLYEAYGAMQGEQEFFENGFEKSTFQDGDSGCTNSTKATKEMDQLREMIKLQQQVMDSFRGNAPSSSGATSRAQENLLYVKKQTEHEFEELASKMKEKFHSDQREELERAHAMRRAKLEALETQKVPIPDTSSLNFTRFIEEGRFLKENWMQNPKSMADVKNEQLEPVQNLDKFQKIKGEAPRDEVSLGKSGVECSAKRSATSGEEEYAGNFKNFENFEKKYALQMAAYTRKWNNANKLFAAAQKRDEPKTSEPEASIINNDEQTPSTSMNQ